MSEPRERPPRILIAEDDPGAASVLRALLSRVGYEVEVAGDGAQALRMLEEGPAPDVLLLDWMLPELSGLEICQRVRQRWDAITLPILMVTAKTDAASISAAFDAGASDYLTKPFLGTELRARIASHLRIKQLLEERRRLDEHLMEREKLSTLGLLVGGVAHDLNNPLSGIMGHTQLLLEEETDPEKLTALGHILSEVQRCNRIVGDLLAFVRRRPAEPEDVVLSEVVRGVLSLREQHLRGAGIRVRHAVEPDLPTAWGDPHQLQQVCLNILLNAEHALRAGGDSIQIVAERAPASADAPAAGEWLALTISNNGPRIEPVALERIFDPFFTTKPKEEGTGLGLAVCRRIVRQHGGEIEVESTEAGTSFRILLPAAG